MIEMLSGICLFLGGAFIFIASLGVLRMPDVYTRIHCSTKAGTLGVGLVLLSIALYFRTGEVITRSVATIFFIVLTAPVSAQVIGMVAYKSGVKLWQGSVVDQMNGKDS
ncbi:MAG: monovalent cation/H(+) antiporter subunit G [Candidatus Caldatribacteriota bacterium]